MFKITEKLKVKRILGKVTSFALAAAMALSAVFVFSLDTAFAADVHQSGGFWTDSHETMGYIYRGSNFDFSGKFGGSWKQTTYGNDGFYTFLRLGSSTTSYSVTASDTLTEVGSTEISVSITFDFPSNYEGLVLQMNYNVQNNSSSDQVISIGSSADIQIGYDDSADIVPLYDADGINDLGFKLTSDSYYDYDSQTGEYAQLYFYGKDVKGVEPNISTYWIGRYGDWCYDMDEYTFAQVDPSNTGTGYDSAAGWSWQGQTIPAGETKTFSVIVGIGGSALESFILSGGVNYETEEVVGLNPEKTYKVVIITEDEQADPEYPEYYIISDVDGEFPLVGTDKNGNEYDLIGKSFKIVELDDEDNPVSDEQIIEVSGRPEATDPTAPSIEPPEVLEATNIIPDRDTITVVAENGQHYAIYDINDNIIGDFLAPDSNGNVIFTGLTENTEYIIKTYKPATASTPKSDISDGVVVKTLNSFKFVENDYYGVYDSYSHSSSVELIVPVEGAEIKYATEYNGSSTVYDLTTPPSYTQPGHYQIYYSITKEGTDYYPSYGALDVVIQKLTISNTSEDGFDVNWFEAPKADSYYVYVYRSYGYDEKEFTNVTDTTVTYTPNYGMYDGSRYTAKLYYVIDGYETYVTDTSFIYYECEEHEPQHFIAQQASCTEDGCVEHWVCELCYRVFLDEACTEQSDELSVIIPATGHDTIHVSATEADCTNNGNYEHWICNTCGKYFEDEDFIYQVEPEDVVIEKYGHDLIHASAVDPTCTEMGNIECWLCDNCEKIFTEDTCENEIELEDAIIEATGHDLTHFIAAEENCTENGNIEHWICNTCGKYFEDEDCTVETNAEDVVIEAYGHDLTHVVAGEESCTEDGNIEHWICNTCGDYFTDADGENETTAEDVVIEAYGHQTVHFNAVDPTCTEAGNIECWICDICGSVFTDADCENEIELADISIAPTGHNTVYYEEVEPDCVNNGNIGHWYCEACDGCFEDENGISVLMPEDVVIEALGHDLIHVEPEDPDCTTEGNIEHWICNTCGEYFTDEDASDETTSDDVVIEKDGHELTHVAAAEENCVEDGNIEHWICNTCGKYFEDEECTVQTTAEDVVIEAYSHDLTHVAAVEENCVEDGNIEHWICNTCGKYFEDEECTVQTTAEDVVIEAYGHNWSDKWSNDENNHWHECLNGCGEIADLHAHDFTGYYTVVEPTQTQPGTEVKRCNDCLYQDARDIPVLPAQQPEDAYVIVTEDVQLPEKVINIITENLPEDKIYDTLRIEMVGVCEIPEVSVMIDDAMEDEIIEVYFVDEVSEELVFVGEYAVAENGQITFNPEVVGEYITVRTNRYDANPPMGDSSVAPLFAILSLAAVAIVVTRKGKN